MLITFTQSGSLFNVDFQFDSFNQGDNNTHIVDVAVLDESFSNYEYNGYIQFIREGDKLPSDKFIMANKRILVDGVAYNGYTFKMASDWYTAVAGVLKATIEIKKFSNGVMESNKAYGIVNIPVQASVSAISEVDSKITDEEYNSLVDLINSKLNKDDYDIEDLGYLDTNEDEAIKTAIQHRLNNYSNSNIYKYTIPTPGGKVDGIVILGYDLSAMWAVSISGNNIKSFEVDTTKNEVVLINRDVNVQQLSSTKANISNIKVNTNIEVPAPVGDANAVNKYYLDSNHYNKNEIDSSLQNVETNLNYNIQGALDSSKSYTDLKHNELKALLDTLLQDAPTAYDTLKEIADYIASDKTGASEMLSKINNNTSEINVIKQGLPETLDIVLRSVVSPDTTYEIKEIEINNVKYKIGVGGDSVRQALNWDDIKDNVVIQATDDYNVEINLEAIDIEDVKLVIDLNNDYVNGKPIWEYARGLLTNINTQEPMNLTFKFDDMKNSELRVLAHYDFGDVYALDYNTAIGFENNNKQYYCPDNISSASVHKGEYYQLQMNFADNTKYILTDEEDYINIKYIHDMEV